MSEISVPIGARRVAARLRRAQQPRGTVLFVHGSGVDRHDPLNRFVANKLHHAGFDTVLLDLLERYEAIERHNAFDIDLQAARLEAALERLQHKRPLHAPLGYFATGVGAGVALLAAAKRPEHVAAIVSRSGRPDKALFWLPKVQAPTLLIVDEPDDCNRSALERLTVEKDLAVVPSASHLFHEPEALEAVAQHALRWFSRYLVPHSGRMSTGRVIASSADSASSSRSGLRANPCAAVRSAPGGMRSKGA
jgi:pimeloyl-ACP methyl ester carboxylesterase